MSALARLNGSKGVTHDDRSSSGHGSRRYGPQLPAEFSVAGSGEWPACQGTSGGDGGEVSSELASADMNIADFLLVTASLSCLLVFSPTQIFKRSCKLRPALGR